MSVKFNKFKCADCGRVGGYREDHADKNCKRCKIKDVDPGKDHADKKFD